MPREDLAERLEGAAIGGHPHANRHLARQSLAHAVDRQNLGRQNPHRLIVSLQFAANHDQRAGLDQARAALVGLGKRDDLHPALRVFEREYGHAVALARLELAARGDDAPDDHVAHDRLSFDRLREVGNRWIGARSICWQFRELGRPARAERLQLARVAVHGVAAKVQPERFLLEGQLLGLGPGRRVRKLRGHRPVVARVAAIVGAEATKQLRLPFTFVALVPGAVLAR